MDVIVKRVRESKALEACFGIRRRVFIEEQQVLEAEEIDGLDNECTHYLSYVNEVPVATARVCFEKGMAKVQRVAVLAEHRGQGLGKQMIQFIIDDIKEAGQVSKIALGAQVHAISFYERLGFSVSGPLYMDAGIAHKDMVMDVSC